MRRVAGPGSVIDPLVRNKNVFSSIRAHEVGATSNRFSDYTTYEARGLTGVPHAVPCIGNRYRYPKVAFRGGNDETGQSAGPRI